MKDTPDTYRIQSGPVTLDRFRQSHFGGLYRATMPNGYTCRHWHSTPEAAIDCLERTISESYRP